MSRIVGIEALSGHTAATLRRKMVFVPEWDGDVVLREFTGAERMELIAGTVDLYQMLNTGMPTSGEELRRALEFAARVVQMAWINGDGEQVVDAASFDMLLQVDLPILMGLAGEALRLSRMAPGDVDEVKKSSSANLY
jgi:hypothetical protein